MGGNGLFKVREVANPGTGVWYYLKYLTNTKWVSWLFKTTAGYLVIGSVVLALLFTCAICCCRNDKKGGRAVAALINVHAPAEFIWKTWPQQYEMSNIYAMEGGEPIKGGIY